MKKPVKIVIAFILSVLFIGLTACIGTNWRELTLTEIKDSLKNDFNIEVSEIYGESDKEKASSSSYRSFRYDFDLFEWTDEETAEAIIDKLEKWPHPQFGYYEVLYCKTVGGGVRICLFC